MGCYFLFQGIFLTLGSNPCLMHPLHWQVNSLPLSHVGSPLLKVNPPKLLYMILYVCILYIWRRQWHPTPVLLLGKSHGRRSPVGCSPWGREELDMTERLHFHFSLLCIGERAGNPLQCSCLENPRDGVAQSQTRLK